MLPPLKKRLISWTLGYRTMWKIIDTFDLISRIPSTLFGCGHHDATVWAVICSDTPGPRTEMVAVLENATCLLFIFKGPLKAKNKSQWFFLHLFHDHIWKVLFEAWRSVPGWRCTKHKCCEIPCANNLIIMHQVQWGNPQNDAKWWTRQIQLELNDSPLVFEVLFQEILSEPNSAVRK